MLHLHGHWEKPEAVILGIRSYEDILRDAHAQAMLHALRAMRTLVFVGCGEGLNDPNFGALLEWVRKAFASSTYHHYRLACGKEIDGVRAQHTQEDRIVVVSYGKTHAALPGFLERLTPPAKAAGMKKVAKRPPASVGAAKAEAFAEEYRKRLKAQHER